MPVLVRSSSDARLVGVGLDREQDLAFLDLVAVGELARPQISLHARAQVDLVDGGGAADQFGLLGERPGLDGLHENGGRRRGLLRPCGARLVNNEQTGQRKGRHSRPSINHDPRLSTHRKHCLISTKPSLYFQMSGYHGPVTGRGIEIS